MEVVAPDSACEKGLHRWHGGSESSKLNKIVLMSMQNCKKCEVGIISPFSLADHAGILLR